MFVVEEQQTPAVIPLPFSQKKVEERKKRIMRQYIAETTIEKIKRA